MMKIVESPAIPRGTILIVSDPGEYVDVVGPDGRFVRRVEVRKPSGAVITNVGVPEVPVAKE